MDLVVVVVGVVGCWGGGWLLEWLVGGLVVVGVVVVGMVGWLVGWLVAGVGPPPPPKVR